MKSAVFLIFLLLFSTAFAIDAGFLPLIEFGKEKNVLLWFSGAEIPIGSAWVIAPSAVGTQSPAPVIGQSYIILDSPNALASTYFLGAVQQLDYSDDSVFVVWAYFTDSPSHITFSFHDPQIGWRGVRFGSNQGLKENEVEGSFRIPNPNSWHAFLLPASQIFDGETGTIDGMSFELNEGVGYFDSLATTTVSDLDTTILSNLTFELEDEFAYKGGAAIFEGTSNENVTLRAVLNGNEIFSEIIRPNANDEYRFVYPVALHDPKGKWIVTATNSFNQISKELVVIKTPESEELAISFIKPFSSNFEKGATVPFTVKVTHDGSIVENAVIGMWTVTGERAFFEKSGPGEYSFNYDLPRTAKKGVWNVQIAGSAVRGQSEFGAETSIPLIILESDVSITRESPVRNEFLFGDPFRLTVHALYEDGQPVDGTTARVEFNLPINNKTVFDLNQEKPGVFSGTFSTSSFSNTILSARVSLLRGEEKIQETVYSFLPEAYWFQFVKTNILFFAFPLVLLILALFVWMSEFKSKTKKSELVKRRSAFIEKLKKLEDDYYNKGLMKDKEYDSQKLLLETKIAALAVKIKSADK
ncbi:hypothetical protein CL622_02760 [archaeon]|nr:hypothetical protein [archaeon]